MDLVDEDFVDNLCGTYGGIGVSAKDSKTFPPLIKAMEEEILKAINLPNYLNN
jgi:hypothetical protein